MGLTGLKGLDVLKVELANKLYWATNELAKLAIALNIRASIKNPTNSLFWCTDPMLHLSNFHKGAMNNFHSCMMGGDRFKQTSWWCSDEVFNSGNLPCSGDHAHKPWSPTISADGVHYLTKEEAEYSPLLCKRVTVFIVEELAQKGVVQPATVTEQVAKH